MTIRELNFYDVETEYADKNFDVIIFGSSFMLMPDQVKALEIAKSKIFVDFRKTQYKRQNLLPFDSL